MRVDVTFLFSCSVEGCDKTEVQHRSNVSSYRIPVPWEPSGWTEAGRLLFCPRHTLMLQVDGQEVPMQPEHPNDTASQPA
jgi:hypothetical protein